MERSITTKLHHQAALREPFLASGTASLQVMVTETKAGEELDMLFPEWAVVHLPK
jgi:hypothetical protein